jgi:threonine dehydrogenase-like Zn-dependent dehydrogenase
LIGKHPEKMAKVDNLQASFMPGEAPTRSFDLAMDCTGSSDGFAEALRILKPEGKLILKTTVAERDPIDLNHLVINEITVVGSRCGSMEEAIDFLSKGLYRPSILTTARFPLSQGKRAFQAARDPNNIKVLFHVAEEG